MISMNGRHALVTGAATGIGAKTAELLAKAGATVALADIDEKSLQKVASDLSSLGVKVTTHALDVTKADRVAAVYETADREHGGLDAFVHCAGIIGAPKNINEMEEAEYDRVVDINAKGIWLCTRAAAKLMLKANRRGSIVNLASILGVVGQFGMTAYGSSKAAVVSISYNAAIELGKNGIRVNSILPGHTKTKMFIESGSNAIEETLLRIYPLGKVGEAVDVANTALFLTSDLSSHVTGASHVVDGGMSNLWNIA
jgi:3-oxoacyl-[acyl-carrier protein] reductase